MLLLATIARAQSVRWEANDPNMPNAVQLMFENCEPDGQPELPPMPGVTLAFVGRSESTNIVNFTSWTRTVTLHYEIPARRNAPIQIPGFTVKTNKGPIRVAAFNAAAPAAPLESVANSKLVPERTRVWAGEVFDLNYELSALSRNIPQVSPTFDWNAAPLVAEDWSKPEVNGNKVLFRTRVSANTPNTLKLEAVSHIIYVQTGTAGSVFFPQPRIEPVSVTSDQPVIEVRALPTPPAGFSGAVGQFKVVSKVVPEKAAVGEPITWTVELSGPGNWPDLAGLPSRSVSNDFQVVQPKARRTPAEGKLFDVTLSEDVVLVPTKAGSYPLGPIAFTYFDPKSGSYKTISTPRTTVTITAPNAPQFNITTQPAAPASEPAAIAKKAAPPSAPSAPAGIPRDPLGGADSVRVPLTKRAFTLCLLSPFLGLLLFWTWLAIKRAQKTDPVRPLREAWARLAATLSQMPAATDAGRPALLLAWQRDSAILWQISHAAPPAAAFDGGAVPSPRFSATRDEGTPPPSGSSTWATLWRESDRALYGPHSALPSDWVARAQAALAAKRVPGFKPLRLLLPQNLFPFAAALAFLVPAISTVLHAANVDPAAAYRQGDFAAAEKIWRANVARTPTDWIARHNLSLSLAQQERAGEAAAQAAAAFVQHPSDASVQWHFTLAAEKAGFVPAALVGFLAPGPLHRLARLCSPGGWQVVMIAAAFLVAAAFGWRLLNAYGRQARGVTWGASALFLVGALAAVTALDGVLAYGVAVNPEVVIVSRAGTLRSIPTEADTTQKTTPLAAGSMAIAERTFLGWTRLAFENGQTGWVRKEEIVPVWK